MKMRQIVASALTALFLALSALHVFWALGGRWGTSVTVPTVDGRPAFQTGPAATLVVAALLATAAMISGTRTIGAAWWAPAPRLVRLATVVLSAVFAARAVGNFRTFGFLKVVHDTAFARYDTFLFSPLCVAVSFGCLFVALAP
jgi:hypothetical protein